MITGIIIALADEVNSLTSKKINKGDCVFIKDNILVCCSGAGPANARQASQALIDKGATKLISWGCAAALKPELSPGDLVLPETLLTENLTKISQRSSWFISTKALLSELMPKTGTLIESSSIIAESNAKAHIHQQSSAIALDMESIAVAQVAQEHNIPNLTIRCIADPVSMSLPKAISHAMNQQGNIELSKLLWFLLSHPNELPGLIKLGLHFNAAKNKLKLVAKHIDTIVGFEQSIESK